MLIGIPKKVHAQTSQSYKEWRIFTKR